MLARLEMELDGNNITYRNSSVLQGVLFDKISNTYAEHLHSQSMHPYSEYCLKREDRTIWVIQTLNNEAYQEIILPLMDGGFQSFHMEKTDKQVSIKTKHLETIEKKTLIQEFYDGDSENEIKVRFMTATSFRQNGVNVILPDIRLIFQNLMNRYSASSEKIDLWDEDTLEQLTDKAFISKHRIHSVKFPLEGVYVPGFMGDVSIRLKGQDTLKRYVRFLMRFAEYSGIGIKTSMGMGAVKMMAEEKK